MPLRHHRMRTSALVQQRARELRQQMTAAERILWERLRERRLDGRKFRRQHPLGPFVADFYCPQARLVVEVDGGVYGEQQERDEARTAYLEAQRYRLLRVANEDVHERLEEVLRTIRGAVRGAFPPLRGEESDRQKR